MRTRKQSGVVAAVLIVVIIGLVVYRHFRTNVDSGKVRTTGDRMALLDNSLRAIADGESRNDRERWDPEWVAHQLHDDPAEIFSWVRNNTDWVPYHGVLRGSIGVLMDRQGNSLDRSLLLAKLLIKAGHTVRLAHATIPDSDARKVVPFLAAQREARALRNRADISEKIDIRATAASYHLAQSISDDLAKSAAEFAKTLSKINQRSLNQTSRLSDLARVADTSDLKERFIAASAALTDHWWVQLQRGGEWIDLDLSGIYPKAETTPSTTSLDIDQFHQIVLRLIVERESAGALVAEKAFEHALPAFATIGQRINLTLWPSNLRVESLQGDANATVRFRAQMLAEKEWMVRLIVGNEVAAEYALHATGRAVNAGSSGLSGLGNAIAGIAAANDATEMTAVWVEYEIDVPGQKPGIFRRPIFDLIGDGVRQSGSLTSFKMSDSDKLDRSLSLMRTIEIMPMVSAIAPQYVAHLAADATLKNAGLLRRIVSRQLPDDPVALRAMSDSAAPAPSPLYTVALSRMQGSNDSIDSYIDEPNIITRHSFPAATHGTVRMRDAIDIVSNHVGIGFGVENSTKARMRQGVRDTNAETVLFPDNSIASVSDAFEKSNDWKLIESPGDAALAELQLPERVKATIKNEVDAGNVIVAPAHTVDLNGHSFGGWWRIDRATGATLGVTADGMGGDVAERQALSPIQKAFLMGWEGFGTGFMFEFFECMGTFVPSNPESIKNAEISGIQSPFKLLLPANLYAEEPNANWCFKSALKVGAVSGIATFVSVTWPMVVATLKQAGKSAWFAFGNSVAVIAPNPGAGTALSEDAALAGAATGSATNSEPCPPQTYEGPTEPLVEAAPSPGTEEPFPPGLEPPEEPLAFDPNTPVTKPGPRNNGYGYPANTPDPPGYVPTTAVRPRYPYRPPPRDLYESNPTRYKEGLESAQAEFDKALAEYRSATTRSEELKGLPDTDKDKRMVRELEQMAEFRLGRAITRLNNAKAAPQLDKALDGPNKELNDAFDELKKYPMPEGAPAEGEAWDNFRRAFKRFQDAKSAYDAALAKAWGDYSASGAANQAASKTASMPERPLLPGEKTRPLGNSPTVCGEAPAPLASGAGMGGVAQAVNNK